MLTNTGYKHYIEGLIAARRGTAVDSLMVRVNGGDGRVAEIDLAQDHTGQYDDQFHVVDEIRGMDVDEKIMIVTEHDGKAHIVAKSEGSIKQTVDYGTLPLMQF